MATYSVAVAKHATLSAATVDTVTITETTTAVEVVNRSSSDTIYFTVNGTVPTSAGDDTFVVPPGGNLRVRSKGTGRSVKLISSGAAAYSVTGIQE